MIDILDIQSFKDKQFFVNLSAPDSAVMGEVDNATVTIHSSHRPIEVVLAPAMQPGYQSTGGVSGQSHQSRQRPLASPARTLRSSMHLTPARPITNAKTRLTRTAYFQFTNINNTYTASGYQSLYKVYVNHSLFGEGYSENFTVYESATAPANAVINMVPAHITLTPDNSSIVANASDNVTVSAYVTDALGGPVVDGFVVAFSMNDTTTGSGLFRPGSGNTPVGNTITATTVNGYAKVRFGWATRNGAINIKAAWAEDDSIYGTSVETILQSPPPTIRFSIASLTVNENAGTVTVTLQKNGLCQCRRFHIVHDRRRQRDCRHELRDDERHIRLPPV